MTMAEAISRFLPDGSSVAMGCALEAGIPFAAGHEIIRQRRRDLSLIGPISDSLFDQLIGAGCVGSVQVAWIGNVSEGLGHNYRRAAEQGVPRRIEIRDHTNFSISLALWAAAWGSPYIPTVTLHGSDLLKVNPGLRRVDDLVLVEAVRPDVTILHVQRADPTGRCHTWGPLGITEEAALAAGRVIIVCEELVPADVILSDPNRILIPETCVVAVVHEPGGCHPSPLQGYWRRDHAFQVDYAERSRQAEHMMGWLEEWVYGLPDRAAYLRHLAGRRDLETLRIRTPRLSVPVDYGCE